MKPWAALLAGLALAGCAGTQAAQTPISEPQDRYVGKTLWIAPHWPLEVCSTAGIADLHRDCFTVAKGTFTVDREIIGNYHASLGYAVTLADGRTGYVSTTAPIMQDDAAAHKARLAAKATCDRKGGVRVGMTREQVYATCWGKPRHINKTIGTYGVHEQLVYGGGQYLYLDNGVLRSIQTSQ